MNPEGFTYDQRVARRSGIRTVGLISGRGGGAIVRCVLTLLLLSSGVACSHLFYYPDSRTHGSPAEVGLNFDEVRVATADGEHLAVWHLQPKAEARRTTVLHFHGNAENMTTHFRYVAWLAEIGFDVVTFDYRGYGRSSGSPSREGLIADGKAMLAWVREHPRLGGQPLIVLGQSLGGAVAVPVVAEAPSGSVQAIVVEATFDSYRAIARGKLSGFWLTWLLQIPISYLVSDDWSAGDYVQKLQTPLIVIHGDDDQVVPIEYGRRLYARTKERDKQFWELKSEVHVGAFVAPNSPERARLVAFICQVVRDECAP